MSGLFDSNNGNQAIVIGRNDVEFPESSIGEMTINRGGMQRVAQALPPNVEIVRMGKSYVVRATTGLAALTALPTVTAGLSLYNGEAIVGGAGVGYIIDSVFCLEGVTDATQQDYTAIMAMISKSPVATLPVDTLSPVIRNLSGKGGVYGGLARVAAGATVLDEGWMPVGNPSVFATAFAGALWKTTDIPLNGLYVVRPGAMFNLHVIKLVGAALQNFLGIRYHEKVMDFGV